METNSRIYFPAATIRRGNRGMGYQGGTSRNVRHSHSKQFPNKLNNIHAVFSIFYCYYHYHYVFKMRNTHNLYKTTTTARMYVCRFSYNEPWLLRQRQHVKVSAIQKKLNNDVCRKERTVKQTFK